uniref:Uncharacterized protein n=1 Tax=viral metagenome TaxID=1070528 RepID=A0A6M3J9V8_9ZZZZ
MSEEDKELYVLHIRYTDTKDLTRKQRISIISKGVMEAFEKDVKTQIMDNEIISNFSIHKLGELVSFGLVEYGKPIGGSIIAQ